MNTNIKRKQEYVRITSEMLEAEGIEGVTIRKVANAAGCTSAVLYKHFENRDHLLILASVHFLENYIRIFKEAAQDLSRNSIETDLYLWEQFIHEAFSKLPYYEIMFFGKYKERLESIIYEYYQLFPEKMGGFDGFATTILFSNDLEEREFVRLRRAANEGLITMDNARSLSRISVRLFHGCLVEARDLYGDEKACQKSAQECFSLMQQLFQHFIK